MIGLDTRKSPTTTVHLARAYEKPGEPPRFEVLESPIPPPEPLNLRQVPHPESPIAKAAPLNDPAITGPLLVDYLAGYTASRLCASYNITLPQLFAWRRSPETQQLLREHEEFAAEQTRHVQHDKEPEIILTLCAIATRGTSEAECRRAASDLLRAFKFREYLAQRKPRNPGSPSNHNTDPDPKSLPDPDPRLPSPIANPYPSSLKSDADPKCTSSAAAPSAPSAGFANLDTIASLNDARAANLATEILRDEEADDDPHDPDNSADDESAELDDRADGPTNQLEDDAADDESDIGEEDADFKDDETDDDDDPDGGGQPAAPRALKHNTPEDDTHKHNTARGTPHSLCEVILNVPEVPSAYSPAPPDPPPAIPSA